MQFDNYSCGNVESFRGKCVNTEHKLSSVSPILFPCFRGKCVNTLHKLSSVSPVLFPRVMCEHSAQTLFCFSSIVSAGNV